MRISLPSRKVLYLAGACGIILAGVAVAARIAAPSGAESEDQKVRAEAFSVVNTVLQKQADGKPDTLADMASTTAASEEASTSPEIQTATDRFSQIVLAQYAAVKSQKGTLTDDDRQAVVQAVLSAPLPTPGPKIYKKSDLKIITAAPAEIHAYGNSITKIFLANIPKDAGREIYILGDLLETKDASNAAKLNAIADAYDTMIAQTIWLKTPDFASDSLLAYVNSLSGLALSIREMSKVLADPILAIKGMNKRAVLANKTVDDLEAVGAVLAAHGAKYQSNEPGANLYLGNN